MRKLTMNGNQKDRFRMRIQTNFYCFYQSLIVRFRSRYVYLDRFEVEEPHFYMNTLFKRQKERFLGDCEKLDQERSI